MMAARIAGMRSACCAPPARAQPTPRVRGRGYEYLYPSACHVAELTPGELPRKSQRAETAPRPVGARHARGHLRRSKPSERDGEAATLLCGAALSRYAHPRRACAAHACSPGAPPLRRRMRACRRLCPRAARPAARGARQQTGLFWRPSCVDTHSDPPQRRSSRARGSSGVSPPEGRKGAPEGCEGCGHAGAGPVRQPRRVARRVGEGHKAGLPASGAQVPPGRERLS